MELSNETSINNEIDEFAIIHGVPMTNKQKIDFKKHMREFFKNNPAPGRNAEIHKLFNS